MGQMKKLFTEMATFNHDINESLKNFNDQWGKDYTLNLIDQLKITLNEFKVK